VPDAPPVEVESSAAAEGRVAGPQPD
jgi:hypothetical protein